MRRIYLLVIGAMFSGIVANSQVDKGSRSGISYGSIAGPGKNTNNTDENLATRQNKQTAFVASAITTTGTRTLKAFAASELERNVHSAVAEKFTGTLCDQPTNVTAVSTTPTTATISFASAGNSFIVEYGAPAFDPGIDNNAGAGGTIVTGTSSPILLSGLTAATTYDVYVRQVCPGPSYSLNSTKVQVTTICAATNVPYFEDFESLIAPGLPSCGSVQNVNGDASTWAGNDGVAGAAFSGTKSLVYNFNITQAADDWFFTRALNLTGGISYRLQFKYKASKGPVFVEKLEVKYGPVAEASSMTAGSLFTNSNIDNSLDDPFLTGAVDFVPSSTGVYFIGFHAASDADQNFLMLDDISVDVTAACPAPIGVSVSATGANSANVSFSSPGNNFVVEYGAPGFTPGTDNNPGAGGTVVTGTSSPITLSGLTGGPEYDVYVRQSCGGASYSVNTGVIRFMINDEASGASLLTLGAGCTGATQTNQSSSLSAGEFHNIQPQICSGVSQSPVWYKFVAPASGAVRVSTDVGSGNTFDDSKIALFSATDANDYSSFNIVSCDDDGGSSLGAGFMSVLYVTGLTQGQTYYIMVDRFNEDVDKGSFCIQVDELNSGMIAATPNCGEVAQMPSSNGVTGYKGWVPLVRFDDSKLIALVRNTNGVDPGGYNDFKETKNLNPVRTDATSGQKYLDRSFMIHYNGVMTNAELQLFFLSSELTALHNVDSATLLTNLGVTRQSTATPACPPDFEAANGTNSYLPQTGNGTSADGLVKWINVTTPGFSNFYLHTDKSPLALKVFLQGAFSTTLGRHKDVTANWSAALNNFALSQPYNTAAFGNYNGTEHVDAFAPPTAATTDVTDWVLLELRDATTPATVIARRAAFVREDGMVVDLDGTSNVSFRGIPNGNYYLAIRHRNHLAIRTSTVQVIDGALGTNPNPASYDLTSAQAQAFQNPTITSNPAMKDFGSGIFGMWGGNANSNAATRVSGTTTTLNDFLFIVNSVLGGNNATVLSPIYSSADVNMDGVARASGTTTTLNDFLFIVNVVLGGNNASVFSSHN